MVNTGASWGVTRSEGEIIARTVPTVDEIHDAYVAGEIDEDTMDFLLERSFEMLGDDQSDID